MAPTHRQNVLKKYSLEDKSYSLNELSKITGIPMSILQQVYNRGIGAYKSNPQSVRLKGSFKKGVNAPLSMKLSKEQWAYARVYSFIDGGHTQDDDLRKNSRSSIMLGDGPPFPSKAFAAAQARHPPPAGVINPYTTMGYAVGGTVSEGILLRRPYNHRMAGMTAFEHGMGHYKGMSHSVRYNPTNQNFAQATFVQGGYFPQADHRLI
jgi:hypothetical protein